jgi:branched-chain amino acid transport system permease protein
VLYVLLGGTQTAWGPLVGAIIFTLLPEFLRGSASLRYVAFAAGVIVLMALRPQGLITRGNFMRLFDWRRPLADSDSATVGRVA